MKTGLFGRLRHFAEPRESTSIVNLSAEIRTAPMRQALTYIGLVIALVAATGLSACQKISHTRVKMTATVETDGGIYTGSSVQEYACRHALGMMGDTAQCVVKGEAVVVDIKDKGYLFLIFDTPGSHSIMSMPYAALSVVSSDPLSATNATLPDEWTLPTNKMPLMAKFDNLNDPYSVQQVDPARLDASFGRGVRLLSVKVETTSLEVTHGTVERAIPWISTTVSGFQKNSTENRFSETLSPNRFTSEYKK